MLNRTGRKKFRLPIQTYLLYLIIASFLFIGVAFSKYTTSGDASDMAHVAKIGDVTITETGDIVSSSTDGNTTENTFIIIPGVAIKKDIRLRFEGSEAACYVFVQITPNGFSAADDNRTFTKPDSLDDALLSWAVDDSWTYLTSSDGSYVYYTAVKANDAIAAKPIIKGGVISVSENLKHSDISALSSLLNIEVKGAAVQIDGNGSYDTEEMRALYAWNTASAG